MPANKRPTPKKKPRRKATPAQQAARKKYLEMCGYKPDPKRIAAVRAEWQD